MTDTPNQPDKGANPPSAPPGRKSPWGRTLLVAALALAVVSATGAAKLAQWLRDPGPTAPTPAKPSGLVMPKPLFQGWDKPTPPDFVLLVSGQQHGYILPCGCSRPQVGGLERRYNLIRLLKERGWPVVAADLGDVPQKEGPYQLPNLQGLIKYRYSMRALQEMGYAAVGLGEYEAALPLFNALGEFALQEHGNAKAPQTLVANLLERENKFPGQMDSFRVVTAGTTKVGITCVVAPTVAAKIKDKDVKFTPTTGETIKAALRDMAQRGMQLPVLLYQGGSLLPKDLRPTEAVRCAEAFPEIPLLVCLSESDEPPGVPVTVKHRDGRETLILQVGHKGKNVVVVGVWRTGNAARPFRFAHQLVPLGEEFLTPKGEEKSNPVLGLMEDYTRELRGDLKAHPGGDYLGRYGQKSHTLQAMGPTAKQVVKTAVATYVGSERCGECHEKAYKVWEGSKHSHAYETLVKAERPSLRQYDPECIVCHTVGFGYQGGFKDAVKTAKLKNVGCESCHGPGSLHASDPADAEWLDRMNLAWKAPDKKKRMARIDYFCQTCHDTDNDVHWKELGGKGGFERKWPAVQHYEKKPRE